MPHPIKASQYAAQWEWFAGALSVWMLIEELWDILAKADNNQEIVCVKKRERKKVLAIDWWSAATEAQQLNMYMYFLYIGSDNN